MLIGKKDGNKTLVIATCCYICVRKKITSSSISTCSPENECDTENGGCDHTCTDTLLSYECDCPDGYELGTDQHSCNGECSTL